MRIIAGKYNRRFIKPPKDLPVRPTTDLARESLFNILNSRFDLEGKSVLDLFSGTGAVAYEFVSRGCGEVWAVDSNNRCTSFIKKTVAEFQIDELTVFRNDVFKFLQTVKKKFDIIFADPPYDMEQLDLLPKIVMESHLLNEGGVFVLEHSKVYNFSSYPGFTDHRKYGKVNFSFFQPEI